MDVAKITTSACIKLELSEAFRGSLELEQWNHGKDWDYGGLA